MQPSDKTFWVFAYGSLMWRPGFAYEEVRRARLFGFHRALCVFSIRYRGTPERPGLVMGLDRGGSCVGLAYRVADANRDDVIAYLDSREMLHKTYRPSLLSVRLDDGRWIRAYSFVVRRDHRQYAGGLPETRVVDLVRAGNGDQGAAREYLANTIRHLDELGIRAGPLHRILEKVDSPAKGRTDLMSAPDS